MPRSRCPRELSPLATWRARPMEIALIVVVAVLAFELAAVRWGHDSRELTRLDRWR